MRPDLTIAAGRDSHQRLLRAVGALSEDDLRSPSTLPNWSRSHVVAHLINKAHAHVWVFGGPSADEVRHLFPPGYDPDAAADVRARQSAGELRDDLVRALAELEAAWAALDDRQWECRGIMTAGPRTMAEIVSHHLRNVEVHHVDLAIGYRPADWPSVFVDAELARRLRALPDRADHAELLAWLLGRAPAPDLGPW